MPCKQLWQFEQRILQTGSSEGGLQWQREGHQPHPIHAPPHPIHTCVVQHVIKVWIDPGAGDLESTVAQGFVKHGFKVLLRHVVDGPLQVSHCLVYCTPCAYTWYNHIFWALDLKNEWSRTITQTWKRHPWQTKSIFTSQIRQQVAIGCLTPWLRRWGALSETDSKVYMYLKVSPLFLRHHAHFCDQRTTMA